MPKAAESLPWEVAARWTSLDLEDLESTHTPYRGFDVYKKSKLAQTIFAIELDRRLRKVSSAVSSMIAHPGGALDGLTPSRPPLFDRSSADLIRATPRRAFAQGKDRAAWAPVQSLLDPHARGGELRGPRFLRSKGRPTVEHPTSAMADGVTAALLWERSEEAVGHPGFLRDMIDRTGLEPEST